jgi:hypothetical protein
MPDELDPQDDLRQQLADRDHAIAVANARAEAMEQTLNALNRPAAPQQQQLPPGKTYVIPPHIRQQIAAAGLSEQDIETNGDLIVPFLQAYLGQAATEVLQLIQTQADEIKQFHMLRDPETYPHADPLFKEMQKIRAAEAKAGRYVDPDTAYRIAVANNYEKLSRSGDPGGSQFSQSKEPATPVAARSRDASAGNIFRTVRAPTTAPEKPATRADDLMSMSREERRAFFESNAETPIR